MKIVLCTLNSKYIHSNLSLWCLKAGVDAFCSEKHDITVIESTINSVCDGLIERIAEIQPEIVAFSCYIWNKDKILELGERVKNATNSAIIFGGPEVEYCSSEILKNYSFIDYVISGEGEWSFSSFVEGFSKGIKNNFTEGVTFRLEDDICEIPVKSHNETPPSPYCDEYFKQLNGRIAYIEASRGCPFRCSYCLSGRLSRLRYFDEERVFNDIILLSQSGTKTIKFIDRTFNADKSRANNILRLIKDNYKTLLRDDLCFHFEVAADILSAETFEILSEMPVGYCQLEIGIQSFNNKTLEAIKRKTDINKVCENVRRLVAFENMHIHTDLIAGLPYEDFDSFVKGFNEAFYIKSDMLQLGFLKLLHGTSLRKDADAFEILYSLIPPYEVSETAGISKKDFAVIKNCEEALDRLYNSRRFLLTVDYLLNDLKLQPFEFFADFGASQNFSKISLSDFALCLFNFYKDKTDMNILREKILCDLYSLPVNIHIPDEICVYNPLYKTLKKRFSELLQKNVRIVILESEKKVFVVHTDKLNKISGRYFSEKYDI